MSEAQTMPFGTPPKQMRISNPRMDNPLSTQKKVAPVSPSPQAPANPKGWLTERFVKLCGTAPSKEEVAYLTEAVGEQLFRTTLCIQPGGARAAKSACLKGSFTGEVCGNKKEAEAAAALCVWKSESQACGEVYNTTCDRAANVTGFTQVHQDTRIRGDMCVMASCTSPFSDGMPIGTLRSFGQECDNEVPIHSGQGSGLLVAWDDEQIEFEFPGKDVVVATLKAAAAPLGLRETYLRSIGKDPKTTQMGGGVRSKMARLLKDLQLAGQAKQVGGGGKDGKETYWFAH